MKEGTSAVLLQSCLEKWWADSMECYCYLRNIQDFCLMGKHLMRGGGPVVPSGAMVEYHPAKDLSRLHQSGPKVLPGTFLGYALQVERIWKGDILVADIEDLEEMDASEIHAERINAKEVLTPMNGGKFIFPISDGTLKLSGGDQVLRTSTLIRDRPDGREEQGNLLGESDGPSSTPFQDSMISGPFQATLFTVNTWNPESNCTCREKHHSSVH